MSLTLNELREVISNRENAIPSTDNKVPLVRYFVDSNGKGVLRDCSLSELRFEIPLWFGDIRKNGRVNKSNKLMGTFWLEGYFINNKDSVLSPDVDFNDEEILVDYSTYDKSIYSQMHNIVSSSIQIDEEHKRVARTYVANGQSQHQFFGSLNECVKFLSNAENEETYIKVNYLLFFNRKKEFNTTLIDPQLINKINNTRYHKLFQVVKKELIYNQNGYWFSPSTSLPELNNDVQSVG